MLEFAATAYIHKFCKSHDRYEILQP